MALVALVVAHSSLDFLSDRPEFVQLLGFRYTGVNRKVRVADHDLVLPGLLDLLLFFRHLLHHIVSRDEHRVEEGRVSESFMGRVNFAHEVDLSLVCRVVDPSFHLVGLVVLLDSVTAFQIVNAGGVGLLWVLVEVGSLHEVVEAGLGLPACLVLLLLSDCDLVFVDNGECKGEMLLGIGVEVALVLADLLTHLVFLELPNIVLLRAVHVNLEPFWNVQTLFERSARAHALDLGFILP